MNNSQLIIDADPLDAEKDIKPLLRAEESRLARIIEALQSVEKGKDWRTLKTEVFDGLVNSLEKELKTEAKKEDLEPMKLARLSGELKWAEKYSDLSKLENIYRLQLQSVRVKLYGKTEETA